MLALLSACGGGRGTRISPSALGLPAGRELRLAATTLATSPDGGIYRNPDGLTVLLAGHGPVASLASPLGTEADWRPLERLGDLTYVGFRLRNQGKVGSDPRLNDLQVASDLAPGGTSSGPLRHFYHPAYPLAGLSDRPLTSECAVHLDPGESAVVVLAYPPTRPVPLVTWGRYGDVILTLRPGGALPRGTGDLSATTCTPPVQGP